MKKITLLTNSLVLLFCLVSTVSFSQAVEKCATDKMMEAQRLMNPVLFDQNRAEVEAFTRRYAQKMKKSTSTKATITNIPTVVHVLHNGAAVGTYPNISDVQIMSAIANLNDAFKNEGSVYAGSTFLGASSYNSPMDIEFVLAQVKEDGSATNGIERHDVTGKTYATEYSNNGISGGGSGVDSEVLFKDYTWNPQDYMNIWIVNKIDGVDIGTNGNGTLGYATLPGSNPGVSDGLVCQARAFGYYPSYVVPATQPAGYVDYDFGYGNNSANASGNGTADHEVGHYLNLLHTFTGDNDGASCPADVTVGVDSDGCDDIPPHKRTNSICTTDSATENSCTGGGPNEYAHNFMDYSSDPCFTGFSNDQRTRVHAAIDGPRAAFKTSVGHVAPSGNYPAAVTNTPTSSGNSNNYYGGGVFEVAINGSTYKSLSNFSDGFYLNRVASQPATTLVENTLTTMTVQVGAAGGNDELVDVYIDYNNDGTFATNERVHQSQPGSATAGETVQITFTTPATGGFVNNQKLRMRVISDFDNHVNTISNAYTTQIGNIEDYSVIFNPILSTTQDGVNANDVSIYPNPTQDVLNISNTTNKALTSIFIYDALGRQVLKGANTDQISVSHLTNGIYFLKLQFGNSDIVTKRFIKK